MTAHGRDAGVPTRQTSGYPMNNLSTCWVILGTGNTQMWSTALRSLAAGGATGQGAVREVPAALTLQAEVCREMRGRTPLWAVPFPPYQSPHNLGSHPAWHPHTMAPACPSPACEFQVAACSPPPPWRSTGLARGRGSMLVEQKLFQSCESRSVPA